MTGRHPTRRQFLYQTAAVAAATLISRWGFGAEGAGELHLATNEYPWSQFYRREGKAWPGDLDAVLAQVRAVGLDGYEPIINGPADVDRLAPLLKKHGLQMRSYYVNSTLHQGDKASESIEQVVAAARKARSVGTRIIVTNPSPIRWGGPENKTDDQLRTQAAAMNELGRELSKLGLTLAYHNHDIELREAAREFHHMMVGTDPKHVTLCLDAHWVYRGAGNSAVALFDVLKLYGPRITELHLRQSKEGVWTEAFGPGDVDYPRLAAHLKKIGCRPHLVLEQAVEAASPKTLTAGDAHAKGQAYAREVFQGIAG